MTDPVNKILTLRAVLKWGIYNLFHVSPSFEGIAFSESEGIIKK